MHFNDMIPNEVILNKILVFRGHKVILDADLATLYQVETKYLKRQVKRNLERFPDDFMFELTPKELEILRCQKVTSSWGGSRYAPMAFTEQGIAMLSSVLGSALAIQVNIKIIRVFTEIRKVFLQNQEILAKLEEIEARIDGQDEKLLSLFDCMRELMTEAVPNVRRSVSGAVMLRDA